MAAIDDSKTIVEILLGRVATNSELQRIAAAFVSVQTYGIQLTEIPPVAQFADPQNPTNEEKAQYFLDVTLWFYRQIVQYNAERVTRAANDANVQTAKDAAKADLT